MLGSCILPSSEPTPRELQVLELICQGESTKEIAALLGISFKTAACHRMRLMDKAQVQNSIGLFRWAIRRGYVRIEQPPAEGGLLIPMPRSSELLPQTTQ